MFAPSPTKVSSKELRDNLIHNTKEDKTPIVSPKRKEIQKKLENNLKPQNSMASKADYMRYTNAKFLEVEKDVSNSIKINKKTLFNESSNTKGLLGNITKYTGKKIDSLKIVMSDILETSNSTLKIEKESLEEQKEAEYKADHARKFSLRSAGAKLKEGASKGIGLIKSMPEKTGGLLKWLTKAFLTGYFIKKFWPIIKKHIIPLLKKYIPTLEDIVEFSGKYWRELLSGGLLLSFLKSPIGFMMAPFKMALGVGGFITKGITGMTKGLFSNILGKKGVIGKSISGLASVAGKAMTKLKDGVSSAVGKIRGFANNKLNPLSSIDETGQNRGTNLGTKVDKVKGKMPKKGISLKRFAGKGLKGALGAMKFVARAVPFLGFVLLAYDILDTFFPEFWAKIGDAFSLENIARITTSIRDMVVSGFNSTIEYIKDKFSIEGIGIMLADSLKMITNTLSNIGEWIKEALGFDLNTMFKPVTDWFQDKFSPDRIMGIGTLIWDKVESGFGSLGDWIIDKFTSMSEGVEKYIRSIGIIGDTVADEMFGKEQIKLNNKELEQARVELHNTNFSTIGNLEDKMEELNIIDNGHIISKQKIGLLEERELKLIANSKWLAKEDKEYISNLLDSKFNSTKNREKEDELTMERQRQETKKSLENKQKEGEVRLGKQNLIINNTKNLINKLTKGYNDGKFSEQAYRMQMKVQGEVLNKHYIKLDKIQKGLKEGQSTKEKKEIIKEKKEIIKEKKEIANIIIPVKTPNDIFKDVKTVKPKPYTEETRSNITNTDRALGSISSLANSISSKVTSIGSSFIKGVRSSGYSSNSNLAPESNTTGLNDRNITSLKAALGQRESSNDYQAVNQLNYLGKYQFGGAALADIGLVKKGTKNRQLDNNNNWTIPGGKEGFLNDTSLQENTMDKMLNLNAKYLGSEKGDSQGEIAGMLSASHLLGAGGAKKRGGSDANGTTWREYFNLGMKSTSDSFAHTSSNTSTNNLSNSTGSSSTVGRAVSRVMGALSNSGITGMINKASSSINLGNASVTSGEKIGKIGDSSGAGFAKSLVGKVKYIWGGKDTNSLGDIGLDCSGFIQYVLKKTRPNLKPKFPGDTERQVGWCEKNATKVSGPYAPGDILFFKHHSNKKRKVGHIAMAIGPNEMVHSSGGSKNTTYNPGKGVESKEITSHSSPVKYAYRIPGDEEMAAMSEKDENRSKVQKGTAQASSWSHEGTSSLGNMISSDGTFMGDIRAKMDQIDKESFATFKNFAANNNMIANDGTLNFKALGMQGKHNSNSLSGTFMGDIRDKMDQIGKESFATVKGFAGNNNMIANDGTLNFKALGMQGKHSGMKDNNVIDRLLNGGKNLLGGLGNKVGNVLGGMKSNFGLDGGMRNEGIIGNLSSSCNPALKNKGNTGNSIKDIEVKTSRPKNIGIDNNTRKLASNTSKKEVKKDKKVESISNTNIMTGGNSSYKIDLDNSDYEDFFLSQLGYYY